MTLPRLMSEFFAEKFIKENARWILNQIEKFKKMGPIFKLKGNRNEYLECKDRARKIAEEKVKKFSKFYNANVRRIAIRNQSSRWGSCSKNGNLNFHYKIAILPDYLADYLVIHELCHLKEMNHSKKFWELVSQTVPNYKVLRKQLHSNKF